MTYTEPEWVIEWQKRLTCCGQLMKPGGGYLMGGTRDYVGFQCHRELDGCPHRRRIVAYRDGTQHDWHGKVYSNGEYYDLMGAP